MKEHAALLFVSAIVTAVVILLVLFIGARLTM